MSFSAKRKAKVIKIADEDSSEIAPSVAGGDSAGSDGEYSQNLKCDSC